MVKATYDRTARRHTVEDDARDNPVVAESYSATCRLQKVRVTPYMLGEVEPRLDHGIGQLLDPARNRSIIATGIFCREYCELHPDWAWEAL